MWCQGCEQVDGGLLGGIWQTVEKRVNFPQQGLMGMQSSPSPPPIVDPKWECEPPRAKQTLLALENANDCLFFLWEGDGGWERGGGEVIDLLHLLWYLL